MVVYAPYFISTVVMVGMLIQFLGPEIGIYGNLMRLFGQEPVGLLGKPELFRSVYVWSQVWQFSGFGTIIYLATLSSIDPELHQAAIIDGATRIQRTIYIDIPGIMPTIMIILILTMGHTRPFARSFDMVGSSYCLSKGQAILGLERWQLRCTG